MRNIFETESIGGLGVINERFPYIQYLTSKKFIYVEVYNTSLQYYTCVYLRAVGNKQTMVTAYIEELSYVKYLMENNFAKSTKMEYLAFISKYPNVANLIRNEHNKPGVPFLSLSENLTRESSEKLACIHLLINSPLKSNLLNGDSYECNIFMQALKILSDTAVNYLNAYGKFSNSFSYLGWTKINVNQLRVRIESVKSDGAFGKYINHIDSFKNEEDKNLLQDKKLVLLYNDEFYPINSVRFCDHVIYGDATLFVLAEVFDSYYANSGYFFIINLDYKNYSWYPKVDIGEDFVEYISKSFNNINKVKYAKLDENVCRMMPTSAQLWFTSNPYHDGVSFSRYLRQNDINSYAENEDSFFVVEEPCYIRATSMVGIKQQNIWNSSGLKAIGLLLDVALKVQNEGCHYIEHKTSKIKKGIAFNLFKLLRIID